ncbi:unnamed protein product [Rotaria sp. Silwood2]|nr:unnamed protein product [Rotaria sp. Silwood2]CAF4455441.1 unnamed protein product [Rotaria sp. Silwood2]
MDKEYHQPSLYKNSSLTLFESYIAIEKFIIDTRLSFIDQYKLFDLLKKLLPNEDNHLTCQGFLSWLVWRVDQHEEQQHQQEEQQQQQQQRQSITDKRLHHERMISENVQNEPSELEIEEDHDDDETSDVNHRLDFPASTSTNLSYSIHPIPTKTIMYEGRNMMKHLRPRTTLTSFARHVASDLFSREEIMAKLHVDHNNERDIFLRRKNNYIVKYDL